MNISISKILACVALMLLAAQVSGCGYYMDGFGYGHIDPNINRVYAAPQGYASGGMALARPPMSPMMMAPGARVVPPALCGGLAMGTSYYGDAVDAQSDGSNLCMQAQIAARYRARMGVAAANAAAIRQQAEQVQGAQPPASQVDAAAGPQANPGEVVLNNVELTRIAVAISQRLSQQPASH